MAKIGINGFDCWESGFLQMLGGSSEMEVTHINTVSAIEEVKSTLIHSFGDAKKSVRVEVEEPYLLVNDRKILVTHFQEPEHIPWETTDVVYVVDLNRGEQSERQMEGHFVHGVRKVILCDFFAEMSWVKPIIMGLNQMDIKQEDRFLSCVSSVADSVSLSLKLMNDEMGVKRGFMNATVPCHESIQHCSDGISDSDAKTGASESQEMFCQSRDIRSILTVMPEMRGRFDGFTFLMDAVRHPQAVLTLELHQPTTAPDIRETFRRYTEGPLKEMIEYTPQFKEEEWQKDSQCQAFFDASATKVIDDNLVQIVVWINPQYEYANRIVQLLKYLQNNE